MKMCYNLPAMSSVVKKQEQVRWSSIDEVPKKWRHLVPPVPARSWTLDVPRNGPGKPHPDAEARVRAKLQRAAEREKLSRQGAPLFMRFSDGSVVKCFTEAESRGIIDRLAAFRAKTRGGWNTNRGIRAIRDRDAAKLGVGRKRAAA